MRPWPIALVPLLLAGCMDPLTQEMLEEALSAAAKDGSERTVALGTKEFTLGPIGEATAALPIVVPANTTLLTVIVTLEPGSVPVGLKITAPGSCEAAPRPPFATHGIHQVQCASPTPGAGQVEVTYSAGRLQGTIKADARVRLP